MGATRAHHNRGLRQEALREQLSKQKHVQHVIEILEEINDLDKPLDQTELARKKIVVDTKLRLINKYLPDLKSTEITGEGGEDIKVKHSVTFEFTPVGADD